MLSPEGENDEIVQKVSDDQLISNAVDSDNGEGSDREVENDDAMPLPPKEALRCLSVVKRYARSQTNPAIAFLRDAE